MLRASAGSIKFISIYEGLAKVSSAASPYAYLLEIDGVKILLDCGWDDGFSPIYLEALRPYLSSVDAVLLSSPEMASCGALPYVMTHLPENAFVAAASSTAKIGIHGVLHPFLYQFPNTHAFTLGGDEHEEDFVLSVDSIYSAFRSVREPYGGKVSVGRGDTTIECRAIFAGRMLGGYCWVVTYRIDELLYCPDFSLKPSYALKRFNVPTSANLVCVETFSMHTAPGAKYEEQLQNLFRNIQHTLRSGGDVLIPCSVAGRGLEILCIITKLLLEKGGDKYKVILASLQAQAIMDKATTMTEALQDDIILGDQPLFSTAIACRTAEEVVNLPGPKVCIADGPTLDYGVSAELLSHMLPASPQGGENLIVFTDLLCPGTNAHTIAHADKNETLSFSFLRRARLSKEELEEYYLEQEREMEDKRRRLDEEGIYEIEAEAVGEGEGEGEGGALEDDDSDLDEKGAAGGSHSGSKVVKHDEEARGDNTPGLVLPPYMHFVSKHLHFPVLEVSHTLSAALMRRESVAYGLLVSDEEQAVLQKRAPLRIASDDGPEELQIRNDVQSEANMPSKIFVEHYSGARSCKVLLSDLSGLPDLSVMKSLMRSKFSFAKKVVSLRGTPADWRQLSQFCRTEKSMKCGENVFLPQAGDLPLELATHVLSYSLLLDANLAQQLPNVLRRVPETNSKGAWEVGWIDGSLQTAAIASVSAETMEPPMRRVRHDEGIPLTLTEVPTNKIQLCAEHREAQSFASGSFFVGDFNLSQLRDTARRDLGLVSDFHRKAPMLVFEEGVCVRKGSDGTITLSSIATPQMFAVRKAVYDQFAQIL